jgi:hypothetical protein
VDGAEVAMARGAKGLEDGPVQDVGAHGQGRFEAEDEDENRGHQRAPAHAGHAD